MEKSSALVVVKSSIAGPLNLPVLLLSKFTACSARRLNSSTGFEATTNVAPTFSSRRSLGTVIALRQVFVGTRSAYCQLLIQPKKILRSPVFAQVIPAYSSGP